MHRDEWEQLQDIATAGWHPEKHFRDFLCDTALSALSEEDFIL
jgi:hypothetical protein